MTITWIAPDPQQSRSDFACDECLSQITKGDEFYTAKSGVKTVRLCEDCTASVEVNKDLGEPDRDSWLGDL